MTDHRTYFGFKPVSFQEKTQLVQGVFHSVAARYDLMNDLMSLGLHRCWKQSFVDSLPIHGGTRVLDVAGGTGDIALKVLAKKPQRVTVIDPNMSMLEAGRDKLINKGFLNIDWIRGEAEALPFPKGFFDIYTIS